MSGVQRVYRRDNQPFAQIPNEAIRNPRMTANGFRLLAYLMSHQDGYELTYGQIEAQTGLGRYAINGAIENLEALGWLRTERQNLPNGQYGPKAWYVLNPTTVGNSTVGDSTMEQPTDYKNTNLLEDNKEEVIPQPAVEDERFEEFWEVYPRKVEKLAARKAFRKAYDKYGQDVIDGARRLASDPNRPTDKNFIPYPASWLNAGGWTNEPYPPRTRTKEELEALARERAEVDRVRRQEQQRRDREQREREAMNAVAPPKCDHGKLPWVCPQCAPAYLAALDTP